MIDPETIEKFTIDANPNPQTLIDLYHPSQLEKRFGGAAETPTVYWPPLMGPEYLPGDETHLD